MRSKENKETLQAHLTFSKHKKHFPLLFTRPKKKFLGKFTEFSGLETARRACRNAWRVQESFYKGAMLLRGAPVGAGHDCPSATRQPFCCMMPSHFKLSAHTSIVQMPSKSPESCSNVSSKGCHPFLRYFYLPPWYKSRDRKSVV